MKRVCYSNNSMYFLVFGDLYQVKGGKRIAVFKAPLLYCDPEVAKELAGEHDIDLRGSNDVGTLEKWIGALKEKGKLGEEIGGIFVGTESVGDGKARVIHTGRIVRFGKVEDKELTKFLESSKQ